MIKIAKELNKVIDSLEQMGLFREASDIHNVFIKVAQGGAYSVNPMGVQNQGVAMGPVGGAIAGAAFGTPGGPSSNYQKLIQEYKTRLYNEAATGNDGRMPQTSSWYAAVFQSNQLTPAEQQAFRAQAYKIRLEAQATKYGRNQPQAGQINVPLMVENSVKQSGLLNETNFQNVDSYIGKIYNQLASQITQSVPAQQQAYYLSMANKLIGTYINNKKASMGARGGAAGALGGVAGAVNNLQPQPQAQQSPVVSPQ
jgi:hypothetical protein